MKQPANAGFREAARGLLRRLEEPCQHFLKRELLAPVFCRMAAAVGDAAEVLAFVRTKDPRIFSMVSGVTPAVFRQFYLQFCGTEALKIKPYAPPPPRACVCVTLTRTAPTVFPCARLLACRSLFLWQLFRFLKEYPRSRSLGETNATYVVTLCSRS
jgi:hypothetical protein